MFLILFGRQLAKSEVFLLWTFLYFFGITHLSHLVLSLLMAALLPFVFLLGGVRGRPVRSVRFGLVGFFLAPLLGLAFLVGYNARHGHGSVISPTSSLFLSGKLIESGAMRIYLDRTCAERPVFLCEHKDELDRTGMHYVWDDDAPTRAGLGMVEASKRLDPIVHDLLTSPDMWPVLVWAGTLATIQQLLQVDMGSGLCAYGKDTPPWWPISRFWPHELPGYMMSAQQRGALSFTLLNPLNAYVMILSGCVIMVCWPKKQRLRLWAFVFLAVAGAIANAAATGGLANIYDRLQGRVTWLLLFAAILQLLSRSLRLRRIFQFPIASPRTTFKPF
ncbi:MAG: hypothetical protein WAU70_13085 [Flavobacteriales bacterium]